VIARPRVQSSRSHEPPPILVYVERPVRPCLSALALHCITILGYILLIVNWILLLKDFPHRACWKLFEVWEVTIGRAGENGHRRHRGECCPPQPTREAEERRKVPQWGPGQSPGQKRIWFFLSITERVQQMHNAVFNSN